MPGVAIKAPSRRLNHALLELVIEFSCELCVHEHTKRQLLSQAFAGPNVLNKAYGAH